MTEDQNLRLESLRLSGGNLNQAIKIHHWLNTRPISPGLPPSPIHVAYKQAYEQGLAGDELSAEALATSKLLSSGDGGYSGNPVLENYMRGLKAKKDADAAIGRKGA